MRDAFSRLDRLQDQVKLTFGARVDRLRTRQRSNAAGWKAWLQSVREQKQQPATWDALWRSAWPLLVYAAGFVMAESITWLLAFALSPNVESSSPLFIQGAVVISTLLLVSPKRWWIYLVLTLPLLLMNAWLFHAVPSWPVFWTLFLLYSAIVSLSVGTAGLVLRFMAAPLRFASVHEVSRFVLCVGGGALLPACIVTVGRMFVFGWTFWFSWETAYVGYVLAIVVFTPTIVLWAAASGSGLPVIVRKRAGEAVLLVLGLLVAGVFVFGVRYEDGGLPPALIYLLVPLLLWATVRFGPHGIASALALITLIAIVGATKGVGPFVGQSAVANVFALQLFLVFVGISLFFLAAATWERTETEDALRASETQYRAVVRNLPHSAVLLFDADLRHSFADGPGLRLLDLTPEGLEGRTVGEAFPDDLAAALAPHYDAALSGKTVEKYVEHARQIYHIQVAPMPAVPAISPSAVTPVPAGMVVLRDVTEQRRARDELVRERTRAAALGILSQEFRTLAEHSPDFIARLDPSGRHVYVNQSGVDLFGVARDQWLGKTMAELGLRQEVYEPWSQALQKVIATRAPRTFDIDVPAPKGAGEVRSLHVRYIPELADNGALLSVLEVATDVTALMQVEARLAEQASELEAIFEAQADGVAVFDLEGRFVRANSALRRLLGFETDGVYTSLSLEERAQRLLLYDEQDQPIPPEQWPQWRVLRGEILTGASALEAGVRTLDGHHLWISITGAPLRAPNGQITGTVLITRDVSARRALERQVAEQAARLEAIFEAMADGILVQDLEGNRIYANDAYRDLLRRHLTIQGYQVEPDSLFAAPVFEWERHIAITDEHGEPVLREAWATERALRGEILTGDSAVDEFTRGVDGTMMQVSVSAAPVRDATGKITGAVAVFRDVTVRRELEHQVREQAAQLEAVFDAITDGVFVLNAQGHMTRINAAARGLFQLVTGEDRAAETIALMPMARAHDLDLGDGAGQRIPEAELPTARLLRGEVLAGSTALALQFGSHTDHPRTISLTGGPLRDATTGHIVGAVGVVRDVTELQRTQVALAEQERLFRTLVENSPDIITRFDRNLRQLYVSPAAEAVTGIPAHARLGKTYAELGLLEADYAPWERHLRAVFTTGKPQLFETAYQTDNRPRRISQVRFVPEFAADGSVESVLGITTDITALKHTEEALRQSEERFSKAFHASPVPMAITSRTSGRMLDVNEAECALLGYRKDELLGHSVAELGIVEPTDLHAVRARMPRPIRSFTRFRDMPLRIRTKSGEERFCLVSSEPIRLGSEECSIAITLDVTERRRAEEALRAATGAAEAAQREEERRRRDAERREQIAESLRDVLTILNSNRELKKTLDYITQQAGRLLSSDAAAIYTTDGDSVQGQHGHQGIPGQTSDVWTGPSAARSAPGSLTLQAAVGLPSLTTMSSGKHRLTVGEATIRTALEMRLPVAVRALPAITDGGAALPTRSHPALQKKYSPMQNGAAPTSGGSVERAKLAEAVAVAQRKQEEQQQEEQMDGSSRVSEDYLVVREEPLPAPYQALLAIPIILHEQVYGGLLLLYTTAHRFSADEVALAMAYGDQVALALANAQLQDHIEWAAVERERNRLARELHDTVTQEIFTASVLAESIPLVWEHHRAEAEANLRQLYLLTRGALAALRALLLELRPKVLEQKALPELLRQLGEAMTPRSGVPIALTIADDCAVELANGVLPTEVKVAFYRIAQEALMNAAKYAQAHAITMHLHGLPVADGRRSGVQLEIRDDGRGFATRAVPPGHFGLGMMRERARTVGATLRITTRPGRGTRVTVKWAHS